MRTVFTPVDETACGVKDGDLWTVARMSLDSSDPGFRFTGLPDDVVLRVFGLLPARCTRDVRLVSRAARDAADAAVESLELDLKLGPEQEPPATDLACRGLERLLARPFARLHTLAFRAPAPSAASAASETASAFRRALARRRTADSPPLRSLSVTSAAETAEAAEAAGAAEAIAPTLAELAQPLERLHVCVPRLGRDGEGRAELADALRLHSRGLRDLSLGDLDSQALPAVCGALRAMGALERLALRVTWRTADATSEPLWAALAGEGEGEGAGGMRRLESLSITSVPWQFFDMLITNIAPSLAALPSLRSLTVDTLTPLRWAPPSELSALGALTHLSIARHGVSAACLAQLTALRSFSALRVEDASSPAAMIDALARLAALTELRLRADHVEPYPFDSLMDGALPPQPLLPSLRVLEAGTLVPLLLCIGGALPLLADLTVCHLPCGPRLQPFERHLRRRLGGCRRADGPPRLTALRFKHTFGSRLRIGWPGELGELTDLTVPASFLREDREPLWTRLWRSLASLFGGAPPHLAPPPPPPSPLRALKIRFGGGYEGDAAVAFDSDGFGGVARMLRGLPALTTLTIEGAKLARVPDAESTSALADAFRGLPSLTALVLDGEPDALVAVLEAAAACPALRARLRTVRARWFGGQPEPEPEAVAAALGARLRPFAALRQRELRPLW